MVQPSRGLEWNDGVETRAHEAHDRPRARERVGGDASRPYFCSSANGARGVDEQLELATEWKLDKNFERRGPPRREFVDGARPVRLGFDGINRGSRDACIERDHRLDVGGEVRAKHGADLDRLSGAIERLELFSEIA